MKYIKDIIIIMILLLLAGFIVRQLPSKSQKPAGDNIPDLQHIYASWDTMEFDKCVSSWLITRFIDRDAKFVFYPQGTDIKEGVVFDVPGADWSRKHMKCTSDCILESMDVNDIKIKQIVAMAHQVEINFWQLDRWPDTQKCFYEVKEIMDSASSPIECFQKTQLYFDKLYQQL